MKATAAWVDNDRVGGCQEQRSSTERLTGGKRMATMMRRTSEPLTVIIVIRGRGLGDAGPGRLS